ncbi:DUF512 domain-containing protein [[Clostridium] polysaccharolyticum]|uniref:Putative radical SAM enzyme, TIGR03279 family n=1 Tax=[Clostridium] polysaccharolyticum TaxID=29364 RepID=A0A1I0FHC5_9FIRM|nr:DUF512 domain-containing protein [[Clostridium] polysaccharolyticum]SET57630.1 putative radical SAM enzyme, TIGR03279 family [[Clostridium] polysaccharolyticum]
MKHKIKSVEEGSIAWELEIEPGDYLVAVNDTELKDIFDYHFMCNDEYITVLIEKPNGEQWELEIEKEYNEDIGIDFEQGLMDDYRSCTNKCMFCFIDQMPPGMRETLYFKDDDARLSFLQGNYITLTNMKDADLDRIIKYRLSPINISIHTVNPELRVKMLHNRFAGEALKKLEKLYENRIEMNSQIVLCKGINDGKELERSIEYLSNMLPYMESLSVVPVGLTKFRDNLAPLQKFYKDDAIEVLNTIHKWQDKLLKEYGTRFVFASDEWYITAEMPLPQEDYYEGYNQIENGVGMVRSLTDEVDEYLALLEGDNRSKKVTLATAVLAAPIIKEQTEKLMEKYPNVDCTVYTILNDYFGRDITVAGLLTGQDIINQLKDKDLGDYLILPNVLLRSGEEVLLDDLTLSDLEKALQIEIRIVKSDGTSLIDTILND